MGYVFSRGYIYYFYQMFQGLCLFKGLRLFRSLEYWSYDRNLRVHSTYCPPFEMIYVPHFCYVYLRAQKVFARLSYIIIDQLFQALFFFGKSFPFQFPLATLKNTLFWGGTESWYFPVYCLFCLNFIFHITESWLKPVWFESPTMASFVSVCPFKHTQARQIHQFYFFLALA